MIISKAIPLEPPHHMFFDGGGGVLMLTRQSEPYIPENFHESIQEAVKEIETLRGKKALFVMINRLDPGIVIDEHTDTLKVPYHLERWHLPISTNKDAWHQDLNGRIHMQTGFWHGPIPYWEIHSGGNEGRCPRIHLVVDLETNGEPVDFKKEFPEVFKAMGEMVLNREQSADFKKKFPEVFKDMGVHSSSPVERETGTGIAEPARTINLSAENKLNLQDHP